MVLQVLRDLHDCFLHASLPTLDHYFRFLWLLVRRANAREIFDLPFPCLRIQPFRVSRLRDLERYVNIDLYERDRSGDM